ncbi:hypothetical protein OH492_13055 [Vibrio chagasii]|nr:hypothetical protein [Vibrio chagasii]
MSDCSNKSPFALKEGLAGKTMLHRFVN